MKVLLVHAPFYYWGGYIAGGLFAIAEYLTRHGHPTEIIHLALENEFDGSFSITDYVSKGNFELVGISMHWCQQIPAAIKAAENLKDLSCPVVIGGHAATHFDRELLTRFNFIDFIVRGDGEEPLLKLCDELEKDSPQFSEVPNLLYRVKGSPLDSKNFYTANAHQMNNLIYHKVEHLHHYRHYVKTSQHPSEQNLFKEPFLTLLPGRGCDFICSFCGGNRNAQKHLYGRSDVVLRSPEKVMETIVSAYERGYRHFHASFDMRPNGPYYREIFSLIRQRKLKIGFIFESYSLPDKSFLEEFAATFSPGMIFISPESASEEIRKQNKALFFTNRALEETISMIGKLGLFCRLYYGYFLPNDREEDIRHALLTIGSLRIRYRHFLEPFYIKFDNDPCAPYRLDPDSFGMTRTDDSLDYYLSLNTETIHEIPHPSSMSDNEAIRLSRLITFFIHLAKDFTNIFQYANQNSPKAFLAQVEEWISLHPNGYYNPRNFFLWASDLLGIEKEKCRQLFNVDTVQKCHSCKGFIVEGKTIIQ